MITNQCWVSITSITYVLRKTKETIIKGLNIEICIESENNQMIYNNISVFIMTIILANYIILITL